MSFRHGYLLGAICAVCAGSAFAAAPRTREPAPYRPEFLHPPQKYPKQIIGKKENLPGLREVYVSIRQAPQLAPLSPITWLEVWSGLVSSMLSHRKPIADTRVGQSHWALSVRLEARKINGKVEIKCERGGSYEGGDEVNGALNLGKIAGVEYSHRSRYEAEVEGKPETRFYREKLTINGKQTSFPCVEGKAKVNLIHHQSTTLTLRLGKTECVLWETGWRTPMHHSFLLTLRFSPTANWYFFKMRYPTGLEAGPGWVRAPADEYKGTREAWLHHTKAEEEYYFEWMKRAQGILDHSGKMVGTVIEPWE